jgi:molybdenum cofactor synthesis domain-containing protein
VISVSEAREYVLAHCSTLAPRQVPLSDAVGCVLAESVTAEVSVPPFTNSAVDGYAVRSEDTAHTPARLRVVGSVMAGDGTVISVRAGEAVRVMTGAPLPSGADAACMIEHTRIEASGAVVVIEEAIDADTNVRPIGEDIALGGEVFPTGTVLAPPHIGVLASLGLGTVLVFPRPRVGVVSTGDELSQGAELAPGKIHDANRPALLARLRAEGWETTDLGVVGDDGVCLSQLFDRSASTCDVVVASGGVGGGDRDLFGAVLEGLSDGVVRSMQVAIRPGKPFAFGTLAAAGTPVFGLPGNPVAALVSYELFVRPALLAMAGHRCLDRPLASAVAEVDIRRRQDGKVHFVWALASFGADRVLRARPSGSRKSHMLRSVADANALALIPDGVGVTAGDQVDLLILDAARLLETETGIPSLVESARFAGCADSDS